jgi:hypothetical protein
LLQIANSGVDIAKSIPFFGTAVTAIDGFIYLIKIYYSGIIGVCWKYYKNMIL